MLIKNTPKAVLILITLALNLALPAKASLEKISAGIQVGERGK